MHHHRTSHQTTSVLSTAYNCQHPAPESETAYETNKSGGACASVHISHANITISQSQRCSPQQNGPICKGPAHDCIELGAAIGSRVYIVQPGSSVTRGPGRRDQLLTSHASGEKWVIWWFGGKQPAASRAWGCWVVG